MKTDHQMVNEVRSQLCVSIVISIYKKGRVGGSIYSTTINLICCCVVINIHIKITSSVNDVTQVAAS